MLWSPAGEGNTKSFGGRDLGSDGAGTWSPSPFVAGGCRELWTCHPGAGHCLIPRPLGTFLWSRGDTKVLPFSFLFFSFSCSFFPFSPFRPKTWPQPLPHTRGGSPASNLCLHTPLCSCPLLVPPKPPHPAPRWAVTNPPAPPSDAVPPIPFLSILTHFCSFWLNIPPPEQRGAVGALQGAHPQGSCRDGDGTEPPHRGGDRGHPGSSGVGLGSAPGLFTRLGIRSTSLTR